MTIDDVQETEDRKSKKISLDRHSARYREEFAELAGEFQSKCPVAWNTEHGGYWMIYTKALTGIDAVMGDGIQRHRPAAGSLAHDCDAERPQCRGGGMHVVAF